MIAGVLVHVSLGMTDYDRRTVDAGATDRGWAALAEVGTPSAWHFSERSGEAQQSVRPWIWMAWSSVRTPFIPSALWARGFGEATPPRSDSRAERNFAYVSLGSASLYRRRLQEPSRPLRASGQRSLSVATSPPTVGPKRSDEMDPAGSAGRQAGFE